MDRQLLLGAAMLAACAGRPAARPHPTAGASDRSEGIADVDDTCPYLPAECLEGFDYVDTDGCPDAPTPWIALPPGSVEVPAAAAAMFDQIARDVRHLVAGARLVVVVEAAPGEPSAETERRGALVMKALVAHGAPAGRLRVEAGGMLPTGGADDPAPDRVGFVVEGCAFDRDAAVNAGGVAAPRNRKRLTSR